MEETEWNALPREDIQYSSRERDGKETFINTQSLCSEEGKGKG